jgi:spermidine synthase
VKSEIATFFEVFPYGTVWANTIDGQGYDIVLLGQLEPPAFDLDAIESKLERKDYARVVQSLRDVKLDTSANLFATYAGNSAELQPWLKDAAINHDRDLRLQYLAGFALNHADEDAIYREIMQYWAPPVALFRGSPQNLDALFTAMVTKDGGGPASASPAAPDPKSSSTAGAK